MKTITPCNCHGCQSDRMVRKQLKAREHTYTRWQRAVARQIVAGCEKALTKHARGEVR